MMTKDEALDIAYRADEMTLGELWAAYVRFVPLVENTPHHIPEKSLDWNRLLHAGMGMASEASEMIDPFKKELFGKNRPIRLDNIREEMGDFMYYFTLGIIAMNALGYNVDFRDIIKDNVVKLANRYSEVLDASKA